MEKKKEEAPDKDRNYQIRERIPGVFSRNLSLSFTPDPSKVTAPRRTEEGKGSSREDSTAVAVAIANKRQYLAGNE